MYNDKYHDYKKNINGKNFFIELDLNKKILYSWESAETHLAEGAGGSTSFKKFQESDSWQDFIRRTYGEDVLNEVLQKIKAALTFK
jgi:hypothetical protein